MKLIVGLGNPEAKYVGTRHNIGFEVVDALLDDLGVLLNREKFNGFFYKYKKDYIIAKPMTYMNLSGDFVQAITKFFKIDIEDVLVIYDDMDGIVGMPTFKNASGHGGQNGMKDIIAKLGTKNIPRIKIGIGRSNNAIKHVLGKFTKLEQSMIDKQMPKILKGIKTFIDGDSSAAGQLINTK